jgi:hypothetical protein
MPLGSPLALRTAFKLHRRFAGMRSSWFENAVGFVRLCERALAVALLLIVHACASRPAAQRTAPALVPAAQRLRLARGTEGTSSRCSTLAESADSARLFSTIIGDTLSTASVGGTPRSHEYAQYDVVLDIPVVCVDGLTLKVDSFKTRVALDTRVANLVRINAGADVVMGNVDVTLKGIQAKALLLIDLTDAVRVVDQTLAFVDNHPEVVPSLRGANETSAPPGLGPSARITAAPNVDGARRLVLLGTTRNAAGQTVQRLVDVATGDIVERTDVNAGQPMFERSAGNVTELAMIDQTATAAGIIRARVRDPSGVVVSFVRDTRGRVGDVKVERE